MREYFQKYDLKGKYSCKDEGRKRLFGWPNLKNWHFTSGRTYKAWTRCLDQRQIQYIVYRYMRHPSHYLPYLCEDIQDLLDLVDLLECIHPVPRWIMFFLWRHKKQFVFLYNLKSRTRVIFHFHECFLGYRRLDFELCHQIKSNPSWREKWTAFWWAPLQSARAWTLMTDKFIWSGNDMTKVCKYSYLSH